MDKIIRKFKVKRRDFEMIYPFTTYTCVFDADKLPDSPNKVLQKYLKEVFINGVSPGEKKSVSQLPKLIVPTEKKDCELIEMAAKASYKGLGNKQHECVQNFLLDNDPHTIATEVPTWNEETLGHIDIIRVVGDKIQIIDFKPNAHKETKAGGQVIRYVSMLSHQLDLPLRLFEGIYFDDQNSYFIQL